MPFETLDQTVRKGKRRSGPEGPPHRLHRCARSQTSINCEIAHTRSGRPCPHAFNAIPRSWMSSLTLSNSAFVPGRCPALSTNVNSCILSFNPGSAWPVVPACCVSPWFEAPVRGPGSRSWIGSRFGAWVSGRSFGPSPGSRILSGLPRLGPASFHDDSWRLAHPAFHASRRKTFAPVVPKGPPGKVGRHGQI